MAFDLDDEELKATRVMPCNKINYKYKKEDPKDIAEKAIWIINEIFIKQAEENRKSIHRWFEIDYEETQKLMIAIKTLMNLYEKTKADLYEANNCISNLLDIAKKKDAVIDEMAEQLAGIAIWDNKKDEPLILISKEDVIKHFKKR